MNRQSIIIVGAVLVIVIIVALTVRHLSRPRVRDIAPLSVKPNRILDEQVSYPAITTDGNRVVFFSEEDANEVGLYRVHLTTKRLELFKSIPPTSSVMWSPDRDRALFSFIYNEEKLKGKYDRFLDSSIENGTLTTWAFDLTTDQLARLPLGVTSVTWGEEGKTIYYHFLDLVNDVSELAARDPFSSSFGTLAKIPSAGDYRIEFLDSQTLLLVPEPSDVEATASIYLFDLPTRSLRTMQENMIYQAYGSPDGQHILYESAGKVRHWHLLQWRTAKDTDLGLDVENHQAFWLNESTFLVAEWQNQGQRLWLINTNDLTRQELSIESDQPLRIDSVTLSPDQALYFTSDNLLFRVDSP